MQKCSHVISSVELKRAHDTDSGWDIQAKEDTVCRAFSVTKVHTGVNLILPEGFEAQIRPRSGLAAKQSLFAVLGTVDNGYRGECMVLMCNVSPLDQLVRAGDRIAQIVFSPVASVSVTIGTVTDDTSRGTAGLGSTGR